MISFAFPRARKARRKILSCTQERESGGKWHSKSAGNFWNVGAKKTQSSFAKIIAKRNKANWEFLKKHFFKVFIFALEKCYSGRGYFSEFFGISYPILIFWFTFLFFIFICLLRARNAGKYFLSNRKERRNVTLKYPGILNVICNLKLRGSFENYLQKEIMLLGILEKNNFSKVLFWL